MNADADDSDADSDGTDDDQTAHAHVTAPHSGIAANVWQTTTSESVGIAVA